MIGLFFPERKQQANIVGDPTFTARVVELDELRAPASRVTVTDHTALNYSAVWRATSLLSGTIGGLPLNLYRRTEKQGKAVLASDKRNALVQYQPNPEMRSMSFRSQAAIQQINAGNCYAEIERDRSDNPLWLWPIHYTRVRLVRDDQTDELFYEVRNDDGGPTYLRPGEVLHIPSMISDDGITGKGVIRHARESIAMGIATERHGAKWFGSGGIPRLLIEHPGKLSADARANFRKEWKEIYGGAEGDQVALLSEGAKPHPLNVNMEDSQFLQTREHNVNEIARWYGVPPHMLADLRRATYSNIEHQAIEFVQYSLMPWLILWEQELDAKLLTDEEQKDLFFKFNVNGLLRGDSKARGELYHFAINDGWMSHNMVLELEDMNPVPGGDVRYIQGAMVPIGPDGMPILPEPEEPAEPQSDTRESALASAAKSMLASTVSRMLRREAKDATFAAGTPQTFLKWLDGFYDADYVRAYADAIVAPCDALRVLGFKADPKALAESESGKSRDELLELSGVCTPAELAERVAACVSAWSDRAERLAESITKGAS